MRSHLDRLGVPVVLHKGAMAGDAYKDWQFWRFKSYLLDTDSLWNPVNMQKRSLRWSDDRSPSSTNATLRDGLRWLTRNNFVFQSIIVSQLCLTRSHFLQAFIFTLQVCIHPTFPKRWFLRAHFLLIFDPAAPGHKHSKKSVTHPVKLRPG